MPISGGTPTLIPTGTATWVDINHAVSPDGKSLAFTAGPMWKIAAEGGEPVRVTPTSNNYVHAWSPDGTTLAFSADRGKGLDLFKISTDGATEGRLTTSLRADDAPQYTADGRWIYFVSDRAGTRDIWRMPSAGAGPGDSKAEQITRDDREDAAPHPSPDGKWLIYVSYPARSPFNAVDRDVLIRRLPLPGARPARTRPDDIARIVGGHGTLGTRPFSPDGRRFVYASFEPPPPTIRIILFTASDRTPPADAAHRLTQIADAAERFFFSEMTRSPVKSAPTLGLEVGFNSAYYLNATVHELGHALGLSHLGPDPSLNLGNSLMGPNVPMYVERKYTNADQVYLDEASAAILWKHPILSGTTKDRQRQPSVKLVNYKPAFNRAANRITLAGKVVSDMPAHSVIVIDDLGDPGDDYWFRSHVARVASDGTFRLGIDHPAWCRRPVPDSFASKWHRHR